MGLFLLVFIQERKDKFSIQRAYNAAEGLSLNSLKFRELSKKDDGSAVLHSYLHRRAACKEHDSLNSVKWAAVPCCTGVS